MTEPLSRQDLHERVRLSESRALQLMGFTKGLESTQAAIAAKTAYITVGTGNPEGNVTAPVGSLRLRTDGGTSTTLYVKESGSGNTGWVAK